MDPFWLAVGFEPLAVLRLDRSRRRILVCPRGAGRVEFAFALASRIRCMKPLPLASLRPGARLTTIPTVAGVQAGVKGVRVFALGELLNRVHDRRVMLVHPFLLTNTEQARNNEVNADAGRQSDVENQEDERHVLLHLLHLLVRR